MSYRCDHGVKEVGGMVDCDKCHPENLMEHYETRIKELEAKLHTAKTALEGLLTWVERHHELPNYSQVILEGRQALAQLEGVK